MKEKAMATLLIYLCFCSTLSNLVASQVYDAQPRRQDTNPEMDLRPVTRYRHPETATRKVTAFLKDPFILPEPKSRHAGLDYYDNYDYGDYVVKTTMNDNYNYETITIEILEEDNADHEHNHHHAMDSATEVAINSGDDEDESYHTYEEDSLDGHNEHLTDASRVISLSHWAVLVISTLLLLTL